MLLVVGDEEIEVEAWLGVFTEGGWPQWGGILRDVPARLTAAVHHGDDVRIHLLPGGHERRIHAVVPIVEDQGLVEVLFLGTGAVPADLG
ncbi:hypothetical protein ACQEV2_43560 [Streptomyces sp. CA-251387]|uniref:hypothetical protein n=1 Tax=Streptomyces sp. CA-251387 TaxID=3240064 RepID=UPI003D8E32F6